MNRNILKFHWFVNNVINGYAIVNDKLHSQDKILIIIMSMLTIMKDQITIINYKRNIQPQMINHIHK